jgi:hypothetical protein
LADEGPASVLFIGTESENSVVNYRRGTICSAAMSTTKVIDSKGFAGTLYLVTALVTGFFGLRVMFAPYFSGPFYWLPLIAFGAPILLLVGGILTLFPRTKKELLVAVPGIILFVVWVIFTRYSSWTYWIFSVAVIFVNWGVLATRSAAHKDDLAALIASLLLAVIWIPGSLHTFLANLSFIFDLPSEALLTTLPVLLIWALIIGCVICGFKLIKTPTLQPDSQNGN